MLEIEHQLARSREVETRNDCRFVEASEEVLF